MTSTVLADAMNGWLRGSASCDETALRHSSSSSGDKRHGLGGGIGRCRATTRASASVAFSVARL